MIPSNFHTHTPRCMHAVGAEREYIEAAIKAGITELGFADHCPVPFKYGYVSNIRMTMAQAPEYVDTIRALAREYADKIRIYVGFETEYMPDYFDEQIAYFDSLGIDYLIMGEHFIDTEEHGRYSGDATSDEGYLSAYVDTVIKGMKTGRFKYLAHPDLVNFVGPSDIYYKHMKRLCEAMKELDIPLEVNGLGLASGRHYPNSAFWDIVAEVGCKAVVGMDAHQPEFLKDQATYDACCNLLSSRGIEQIFLKL